MKIYSGDDLQSYMYTDWIGDMLERYVTEEEREVRTQEWLSTMDNKRMIYADMYGDLLKKKDCNLRVLDVGGGYNALTKVLAKNCSYTLLDFDAHGKSDVPSGRTNSIERLARLHEVKFINGDWYEQTFDGDFDIVIANDLFPDVDQRLELFIERYIKRCKEMRLLLTFYNTPRFYMTKRVDDTEILTFLSWDGEITAMKLKKYIKFFIDTDEEQLNEILYTTESVYRNRRQCVYLRLKGMRLN